MDPTEALRLIRLHIAQLRVEDTTRDDGWIGRLTQQARDLAEAVEGLDRWLSRDGFLPADWQSDDEKTHPGLDDRILSAVAQWSDEEFLVAFGFDREPPVQAEPYASDLPVEGGLPMIEDDIKIIVDLWLAGHLTAGQAITTVATAVGRVERSDDSLYVGYLVTQAASGRPGAIDALVAEASR